MIITPQVWLVDSVFHQFSRKYDSILKDAHHFFFELIFQFDKDKYFWISPKWPKK